MNQYRKKAVYSNFYSKRMAVVILIVLLALFGGCSRKNDSLNDRTEASLNQLPEYNGSAYITINNNEPFFTEPEFRTDAFESYSPLDDLGRCGVTYANICRETMPTEARGEIGPVKPSGWHTVKYEEVDGKYLYNRCHLIGYQLSAENANERNLITGTRYLNIEGMLPFENRVADYVEETGNHVLYRVTPVFSGENLLADGVLMEGMSVEDEGKGVRFCVYCYNVQPGIWIDYATGESRAEGTDAPVSAEKESTSATAYILNTSTKKFHAPDCSATRQMAPRNKKEVSWSREECMEAGYAPCQICNP